VFAADFLLFNHALLFCCIQILEDQVYEEAETALFEENIQGTDEESHRPSMESKRPSYYNRHYDIKTSRLSSLNDRSSSYSPNGRNSQSSPQQSLHAQRRRKTRDEPKNFQQLYHDIQEKEENESDFPFLQNHLPSDLEDLEKVIQSKEKNKKEKQKNSSSTVGSSSHQERFLFLPRSVARPVERILKISKNRNPVFSPNYYEILQLPFSSERNRKEIDLEFLGKRYRSLSRLIHPDHNPHPSAEIAFDLLHEAYSVLRSPVSREEYNRGFVKFYSPGSPLRFIISRKTRQKLLQKWKTRLSNLKSQLLLSYSQWQKGEKIEQLIHLKEVFRMKSKELDDLFVRFSQLPTAFDRVEYMNEILWEKKYQILFHLWHISLVLSWLKRKVL
jgi:hypothetical protein